MTTSADRFARGETAAAAIASQLARNAALLGSESDTQKWERRAAMHRAHLDVPALEHGAKREPSRPPRR
jgi:hypothetical protein